MISPVAADTRRPGCSRRLLATPAATDLRSRGAMHIATRGGRAAVRAPAAAPARDPAVVPRLRRSTNRRDPAVAAQGDREEFEDATSRSPAPARRALPSPETATWQLLSGSL